MPLDRRACNDEDLHPCLDFWSLIGHSILVFTEKCFKYGQRSILDGKCKFTSGSADFDIVEGYPSADSQQRVGLYWFVAQQKGIRWKYTYVGVTFTG